MLPSMLQHTTIGINQLLTGTNQLQLITIGIINQLHHNGLQHHNGTMLHNTTMLHQLHQKLLPNIQLELIQEAAQISHTAQHQFFQDITLITLLHSQDSLKDSTQLEFQPTPAQTTQNVKYLHWYIEIKHATFLKLKRNKFRFYIISPILHFQPSKTFNTQHIKMYERLNKK